VPPWRPDTSQCPGWDVLPQNVQERAEALAWLALGRLTGGLVPGGEVLLRPCVQEPCRPCRTLRHVLPGTAGAVVCGGQGCSCAPLPEVLLPGRVAAVLSVVLDGQEMPAGSWRLDDGRRLLRTDGQAWPSCQDMRAGLGMPGTFAVSYLAGMEPGPAGLAAAGVLACEFASAMRDGKCRLPSGVTTVVRQGVTLEMPADLFAQGLTGIREVDAYILSINPHRLAVPPRVWSPDSPAGRYVAP
jgi:hypothetical protein